VEQLNGIGTIKGAIKALEGISGELEKIASKIDCELGLLKSHLNRPGTKNECSMVKDMATNNRDAFQRNTLYDIKNNIYHTTPLAVFTDRVSMVYVKSVGNVPVHDVIEIERVDENGAAHTFKGHGVQARDGKWYESFTSEEWELVLAIEEEGVYEE